jgi:large subunit ribosomal protein L4
MKNSMKVNTYTSKGSKKSVGFDLPKEYLEKENLALLAQAVRIYEDSKHPGLSKTKTRSEISLTKRKAYRQKGTGLARHGAKSAPIFVGGSKAHGPKGAKKALTLPKKMKKKALYIALTQKVKNSEVIVISGVESLSKTREALELIKKVIEKENNVSENGKFTFVLSQKNKSAVLALRNLANVDILFFRNLNVHDVYFGGMIAIDQDAFGEGDVVKTKTQKLTGSRVNNKDKSGGIKKKGDKVQK